MKVRNGNYCLFNNVEMYIMPFRYDHPMSESEREYGLFYSTKYKLIEGFKLHIHENETYYKGFKLNEIPNSFKVETKAHYQDHVFLVITNPEKKLINILSNSKEIFEKLGYKSYQLNLNNSISENIVSSKYYFKVNNGFVVEVPLSNTDEVWEEYSPSDFDRPMPEGLPDKKIIYRKGDHLLHE